MANKRWRKILKRTGLGLGLLLVVLVLCLFTTVDPLPYQQSEYYREMKIRLDSFIPAPQPGSGLKAGWARASIVPENLSAYRIASYGNRPICKGVLDTVYASCMVIDNGKAKVGLISLDLLIFPPALVEKLRKQLPTIGWTLEQTYLCASHTHNGAGGWLQGGIGKYIAGEYSEAYCLQLTQSILSCLQKADRQKQNVSVDFGLTPAQACVYNRLGYADSREDGWVRALLFSHAQGKAGVYTFSAHPNCLNSDYDSLSGDYTSVWMRNMEKNQKLDMAMFCAGMVGSHAPEAFNRDHIHQARFLGDTLTQLCLSGQKNEKISNDSLLAIYHIPLALREPHIRFTKYFRLRPWVFRWALGDYNPEITVLRIGNVLMIGTPCDFSGELMADLEPLCRKKNLSLIITSFNGSYIGYVNADKYYEEDRGEIRDMNWFGPQNQAYFTEILSRIIKKM